MESEKLLLKQIEDNNLSSSYIFSGTDFALLHDQVAIFAEKLNISKFNVIEVEPEKKEKNSKLEIKVGAIRELIRRVNLTSVDDSYRLAIIKHADLMNLEASNTLLKTLEEPPKNLIIILLSENLKLLPTIISRCQVFKFLDKREKFGQGGLGVFSDKTTRLKNVFSEIEKVSNRDDLNEYLQSILCELQADLEGRRDLSTIKKIERVFEANRNLKLTTNKRLVLENLYLSIISE